ncbi:hypothetical protein VNO80_04591 [Phaseolus coccineus]|uniref:Uncharacterized protein n=1 Tax=Phaseolus coccineus TaxID=3886 RepID=A0AAN9NY59_PHACN
MSLECNEDDLDYYHVHFLLTSSYLNTDDVDGLIYCNVFVSVGLAGSGWTIVSVEGYPVKNTTQIFLFCFGFENAKLVS